MPIRVVLFTLGNKEPHHRLVAAVPNCELVVLFVNFPLKNRSKIWIELIASNQLANLLQGGENLCGDTQPMVGCLHVVRNWRTALTHRHRSSRVPAWSSIWKKLPYIIIVDEVLVLLKELGQHVKKVMRPDYECYCICRHICWPASLTSWVGTSKWKKRRQGLYLYQCLYLVKIVWFLFCLLQVCPAIYLSLTICIDGFESN